MLDEDQRNLSRARLAHAGDCLAEAKMLLDGEQYKGATNRAYYAAFHAMRAVLVLNHFDSKKHSGIISKFREYYLKNGIFNAEISDAITALFKIRQSGDYDDFYIVLKSEAIDQYENAEKILKTISEYLMKQ